MSFSTSNRLILSLPISMFNTICFKLVPCLNCCNKYKIDEENMDNTEVTQAYVETLCFQSNGAHGDP